jgi:hypothetical protein
MSSNRREKSPDRHLIICVDGVGFSTVERMRADGSFKLFHAPSRMISSFPSLTNAAISKILAPAGASLMAGYEDSYFDPGANKMCGGLLDRFRRGRFIQGTFRELFDYHPPTILSGLASTAPPVSTYLESTTDLRQLKQKAKRSRKPVFFAYTGASDSMAHVGGEPMLRNFLERLNATAEDLARRSKTGMAISIFSDHGNHFCEYKRVGLKAPLRDAGYTIEKSLQSSTTVVLPQFGLVGSAVLFATDAHKKRLAEIICSVEGVDFASYQEDSKVHLLSAEGEATIENEGNSYRYQPISGDPLKFWPVVSQMSGNRANGFVRDEEWFEATRDAERPDAVKRVFEGVTLGVVNRASVIVNFQDGYYGGSPLLDRFASLKSTHGNLGQEQSYGFVMTTEKELPPYIRADDLWVALGSPDLSA